MKNSGEIRQKVKQVRYRYLKKALDRKLRHQPDNCRFNGVHGGCSYKCCLHRLEEDGWNGIVCDTELDGKDRAEACPVFELQYDKEQIKEGLDSFLKTAPIQEIAFYFPDLAALLWVLDGETHLRDADEEEDFQDTEPEPEPEMYPDMADPPEHTVPDVEDIVETASGWKGWFSRIFGG